MAASSQIGAIHVEASLNSGKFVDGAKRIKAAANDAEKGVKKSFGGMQSAVTSSMGALKAGAAGFVAALSVGMFTRVIGNALKYAASLKEVSDRLGVTTKDLQTLRYAAQQSGVAQEALDTGLEKLTITLGRVAAGAREPTKALEAIGITADQLRGKDTGEAFRIIADGLAKVEDRSQRAAVEVALFGEAGARLDGLLSGGSARVNELAAAAEELGIVLSDDQIQKADETADKLDALKTVLQARIAGVVADNADSILQLANALVEVANAAAGAIRGLNAFYNGALNAAAKFSSEHPLISSVLFGKDWGPNVRAARFRANLPSASGSSAPKAGGGGNIGQFLAPKSGGGRKRSARAPRDTSLRDAFQFESELRRAQMDVLRATQSLATDYIDRGDIAIQLLDLEKSAYEAELKYEVAAKEKTQAQADQLLAEYNKKDALDRQAVLAEREAQRAEDSARLDDLSFDLERDRLESEAQLADSASEERAIRLRLLDLAYRQERARLEAVLADEQASFAAKEEARRRLANLNQTEGNDRQAVINGTRGPMEDFMASLSPGRLEEQWQSLQVNGIMGAVDALARFDGKLDTVLNNGLDLVKQFIAEWLRLQFMKGLSSLIGGGSSIGATGDFLGVGALSFAGGGGFNIKGRPGVDNNVLSLNGLPVANVSYGERVSVSNDNSKSAQVPGFVFNNYARMSAAEARATGAQAAAGWNAEMNRARAKGIG